MHWLQVTFAARSNRQSSGSILLPSPSMRRNACQGGGRDPRGQAEQDHIRAGIRKNMTMLGLTPLARTTGCT